MEQKKKMPTQLDKNGNPVRRPNKPSPAKKSAKPASSRPKPNGKGGKPSKKPVKTPAPQEPEFPMDWFFFHPEVYSVRDLKALFDPIPGLDIEIWPDLGVLEITFPSKTFVDFEATQELPDDPALNQFLAQHPHQSAYYVSVEPVCHQADLDFLKETAAQSGGILLADNDELSPVFGI
jgi:hypothetical protein